MPGLANSDLRRGTCVLAVLLSAAALHAEIVSFTMTLDGDQEVPAVDTMATGNGTATLDTDSNLFSWNITFSGLSSAQSAAHFHGPAVQCEDAGVKITLPLGSPIVGSATLTDAQEADVLAGLYYVNVHTSAHTGGEIRGQVMPSPFSDPFPPIQMGDVHVQLETVADQLTAPNWGTAAPGVGNRLFVTDQNGTVWNVNLDTGTKRAFLDASSLLVALGAFGPGSFDERGLLGVTFHPNYQSNGRVYTYTSQPEAGAADFSTIPAGESPQHQSVITEWTVDTPTDPNAVADPNSARELLRIDEPQFNHNAGCLNFGPDGMLYISLGDGGGADDKDGQDFVAGPIIGHGCPGNGQDPNNPLGSILRIDPLGNNSANGQYGIPGDNPFVGQGHVEEIFAFGFRNPFRFSFDSTTGDLIVGDVGQNDIEEINIVTSGGNYGWHVKEGSFFFVPNGNSNGYITDRTLAAPAGLIDPIAEYDHDEGLAVVGGFVYRGEKIPPLAGRYVFGEFAQTFANDGRVFFLNETDEIREFPLIDRPGGLGLSLLGMGQDASGELYVLANASGVPFGTDGVVLRIRMRPGDTDADGDVDLDDLTRLLQRFGTTSGDPNFGPHLDFNDDGATDLDDLTILLQNFGATP